MSSSKLWIGGRCETRIVDEQERISSWLRDADYGERNRDVKDAGDARTVEPVTPPRQTLQVLSYDEVSPTSTDFFRGSVFDKPEGTGNSWIEGDAFCDDISDITSVGDPGQDLGLGSKTAQGGTGLRQRDLANDFEFDSIASCDPPSDVDEPFSDSVNPLGKEPIHTVALSIDPRRPRLTWITSCTQCILADLPCSRTAPCCSRCKRKGQANVCLLHRRRFREEIERSEVEACTRPVLLKLRGEKQSDWKEKLRLAKELETRWRADQDRKNWVLPPIDGRTGDFRKHGAGVPRTHPGEGKGHLTYRELQVVVED